MKRIKPASITREDVERIIGEIATLTNEQRRIVTAIDDAIIAARSEHESKLGDVSAQLLVKAQTVRTWAESHPEEFSSKKSIEFTHGTIGFRTGMPKLKTLPRRTFDAALNFLMSVAWGREFVRTKNEIDKEKILAAHAKEAFPNDTLRAIGLCVSQDETFFIEPKLTDTDTKITQEAA